MAITIIDEKRQHVQNDFEDRVEAPPPWWGTPGRSGPTTAKSSRPFLVGGDRVLARSIFALADVRTIRESDDLRAQTDLPTIMTDRDHHGS